MSKNLEFATNIDLKGNEIKNAVIENVTSLPDGVAGKVVYLTTGTPGYYYYGTEWVQIASAKAVSTLEQSIDTRLDIVEASLGLGGEGDTGGVAERIAALELAVGDSESGLVKDVATVTGQASANATQIETLRGDVNSNTTTIGQNTTKIGQNTSAIEGLTTRLGTAEGEIDALQTAVGDTGIGLVKDVADLKAAVGEDADGLAGKVAANTAAIAGKVDKDGDKVLSDNNFTDAQVTKLGGIAEGAQVNVIESVKVTTATGTTPLVISDKAVTVDLSGYALKSQVASAMNYKTTVASYQELPGSGNAIGDVYNVTAEFTIDGKRYPAGTNVAWDGAKWDPLGGVVDLSAFKNEEEIKGIIEGYAYLPKTEAATTYVPQAATINDVAYDDSTKKWTITKATVGLGNVDNTADADKPVSTATQTALNGKVDKLTSKPTAGSYTKVTINEEGQVTAGAALAASDIPEITYDKVSNFREGVLTLRYEGSHNLGVSETTVKHDLNINHPHVTIYGAQGQIVYAEVKVVDENNITICGNLAYGAVTVVVSL